MYFGTANGAPWNRSARSPAGGDNLFLASIVALNADTGDYVWHYQQTPGERWDYDATPHLMLATLNIDGADRKVLMQASKNGFFYVHRPHDRRAARRRQVRRCELGPWRGPHDGPRGGESGRRLQQREAGARVPVGRRRAQLQSDVAVRPKTGLVYIPTVHSGMALIQAPLPPYQRERMSSGTQIAFATQLLAPESLPPALRPVPDPNT